MFPIRLPYLDADLLLTPPWSHLPPAPRWGLLGALVVVPLVLLAWLYRYELRLVPRATATALFGLRLLVLLLLLALVCLQPIYAREHRWELPGRVLVAVDCSGSMGVADPQREPAEKLRLAKALRLARGVCPEGWVDDWLRAYEENKEPQWVKDEESAGDPARRRQLERERRKAHDELCGRVDTLTRAQVAERVLGEEGIGLVRALAARHDVELMGFHRETWEVKTSDLPALFRKEEGGGKPGRSRGEPPGLPRRSAAPGDFTDLRAPLAKALEKAGPGRGKVLGVVLLTDGQHNWGRPPVRKAQELGERGVPVYPVALGARRAPPDVAVVSVRGPNHAVFKDVDATVDVRFKVSGLKAQDLVVRLHREGKERKLLAERTVRHDGKDRDYRERFTVRMREVGTQTLTATVKPSDPGTREAVADNNERATTISVADDKAKVLVVDGEARWEYHYLASALARDRTVELKTVVFEQPRLDEHLSAAELEKMGSPAQALPAGEGALAGYQCVILGDVPAAKLPLEERRRLERYVSESGGTLVVVAGKRFMPLGFPPAAPDGEADPLRKLLPVESPRVLAPEGGFAIRLARGARDLDFMKLDPEDREENESLWAGRPRPWPWAVVGRAKPAATPLAFAADEEGEKLPATERERRRGVVVRHNYGFGRVLFVGLDSTWRWRFRTGDKYHHRFWGQVVRWAAADKPLTAGNAFVRFGTPQPVYRRGDDVEVVVRLGEKLGPLKPDLLAGARLVRLAEGPKEKERAEALVPLARRPAQPRVLGGKVRDLPPGRYAVELVVPELADKLAGPAGKGGKPLRATFSVLPPEGREMVDLETRWPLLEELAVKSGGKVFTPEEAGGLAELLTSQSLAHVERHEQELYRWWVMLALVVGLLTLEWAGRKLAGLP